MRKLKNKKLILIDFDNILSSDVAPMYSTLLNTLTLNESELKLLYSHCILTSIINKLHNCEQYFDKVFIISEATVRANPELNELIELINNYFTFKIFISSIPFNEIESNNPIINDIHNLFANTKQKSLTKIRKLLAKRGLTKIFAQIEQDPNLRFKLMRV